MSTIQLRQKRLQRHSSFALTLYCGLCIKYYDDSAHKPYTLKPCEHTFCKQCAVGMTKCAQCESEVSSRLSTLELIKRDSSMDLLEAPDEESADEDETNSNGSSGEVGAVVQSQETTTQPTGGKNVFKRKVFSNGNVYEGDWNERDEFHGNGMFMWLDGSSRHGNKFYGTYVHGERCGKGRMEYANGDKFEGEYKSDLRNGPGKHVYANGDVYEGEFRNGDMCGHGKYHFADGDRYEGEFRDGKKNGLGKYVSHSGDRYEGEYRDGQFNGHGKLHYASGRRFEGEWRHDKEYHGKEYDEKGTLVRIYHNGDKFIKC